MASSSPSALITENGRRVLLRIRGRFYDLSQEDLRALLGVREGPPGLGITINGDRVQFEFAAENQTVEMSAGQLHRRLAQQAISKT